jgi:fucose permease
MNMAGPPFSLAGLHRIFIGYAITMLPAGLLADRFGGGIVLVTGTLWWVVFTS